MASLSEISWKGFGLRFLFGLVLVFTTYNPESLSYLHWIKNSFPDRLGGVYSRLDALTRGDRSGPCAGVFRNPDLADRGHRDYSRGQYSSDYLYRRIYTGSNLEYRVDLVTCSSSPERANGYRRRIKPACGKNGSRSMRHAQL